MEKLVERSFVAFAPQDDRRPVAPQDDRRCHSERSEESPYRVRAGETLDLEYVQPDVVHVLKAGRIVCTGGRELIDAIESKGFDQF